MTTTPAPRPDEAPPLLTDHDVLTRVEALLGPARDADALWVLLLDGDGRQTPALQEISPIPSPPDRAVADALAGVYAQLVPEVATDRGPGAVVVVVESAARHRRDGPVWAGYLVDAFAAAGVELRGVYGNARDRVRRLR